MPFQNTYKTFDDVECGLVSLHSGFVLPLYIEESSINVEVINHIGHYTIKQRYANLTDDNIEAVYVFPIQEGGAVHYFKATSDGVEVISVVKEKGSSDGAAPNADDIAMADDRKGFLLSEFKPDLFQLDLGILKPNSITEVELKYVCEFAVEDNKVRIDIPNTVAPQYIKPTEDGAEKDASDQLVDLDKDIDIEIEIKIRQSVAFKESCDSHELTFSHSRDRDEDGFNFSTGKLVIKRTSFEDEVVVLVGTASGKPFGAQVLIEKTSKNEVAAMLTLVPDFPAFDFQPEMFFLVDRSGSMSGRSIEKAKEALHIFLSSLPADCKFNICSFNADFDFLFEGSQTYNDENLELARNYVDGLHAGGGTRVYEPLETIFKQKLRESYQRQIFVVTDGHVSRPQDSVNMVRGYNKQGRVFSLGIGEGASRELVNGLARAGNGSALFVTLAEDLKDKVLELLGNSLLSNLSNIKLEWLNSMEPPKQSFLSNITGRKSQENVMTFKNEPAPYPIPHVFSNKLLVVYQSLDTDTLPVALRIYGKGPNGDVEMTINLDQVKVMKSELIHKLMARRMVKMIKEDDTAESRLRDRVTSLGTSYNIDNDYCSYVTKEQFGKAENLVATNSQPRAPSAEPLFSLSGGRSRSPSPPPLLNMSTRNQIPQTQSYTPPQPQSSSPIMMKKKAYRGKTSKLSSSMLFSAPAPSTSQYAYSANTEAPRLQVANTRFAKSKAMGMQADTYAANRGRERDDILNGFTVLQKADGSFSYGPAFASNLNMTEADITKGATDAGCSFDLFITLLVLAYLRSVLSNRKSSWSRISTKADEFVAANIGTHDLAILDEKAEKFLESYALQRTNRTNQYFKGIKKRK